MVATHAKQFKAGEKLSGRQTRIGEVSLMSEEVRTDLSRGVRVERSIHRHTSHDGGVHFAQYGVHGAEE